MSPDNAQLNTQDVQEPAPNEKQTQEPAEPKSAETAFTKDQETKIQELIAKATKDATEQAIQQAKELGRRELQSQQERNKAELSRLERRAKTAETVLGVTKAQARTVDPEVAEKLELAELRARELSRRQEEQEAEYSQQAYGAASALQASLEAHLKSLGIDVTDKRIDWADDTPDYVTGLGRFNASVAKIVKETNSSALGEVQKQLKELQKKVSTVNVEVNSVETEAQGGVTAGSDKEFVKLFAEGKVPMSKANKERYEKILANYE